jgi:hypothetical protein
MKNEMNSCSEYLKYQLTIAAPEIIVERVCERLLITLRYETGAQKESLLR